MSFLLRVVINAAAIWLAAQLLSGLEVVGGEDTTTTVIVYLVLGLVFGLVNAVVKPIVKLLTLPLFILTLGLITLVVNALMLLLLSAISSELNLGFTVADIWALAVPAGIAMAPSTVFGAKLIWPPTGIG